MHARAVKVVCAKRAEFLQVDMHVGIQSRDRERGLLKGENGYGILKLGGGKSVK